MKLSPFILSFCCIYLSSNVLGQRLINDRLTGTTYEMAGHHRDLSIDNINYNDIQGSPFWNDKFQKADLYYNNNFVSKAEVRINLATDEVYFLKDKEELVLDSGIIDRIVFTGTKDSFEFTNQVKDLIVKGNPVKGFVQVLSAGKKCQLLKYVSKQIAKSDAISPTGKIEYLFTTQTSYYILQNDEVVHIKSLNMENILSVLNPSNKDDQWINENHINFKKEKDVVRFLNYYNGYLGK
jgi:hypothetical protein